MLKTQFFFVMKENVDKLHRQNNMLMKKTFIFIIFFAFLSIGSNKMFAQAFSVAHDTIISNYINGSGVGNVQNNFAISSGASPVILRWGVIATDFPADWMNGSGICDNSNCYGLSSLWPSGTLKTSMSYSNVSGGGDFHLQLNMPSGTTLGSYFVTVRIYNQADTSSSNTIATETFMINNYPTGVPTVKQADEIILYPNPAQNEVNVVFDGNSDIKSVSIYNLIGKQVSLYRVIGNSANLNIESLPTGIYFVRLHNSHGDVVLTRKFTKQ